MVNFSRPKERKGATTAICIQMMQNNAYLKRVRRPHYGCQLVALDRFSIFPISNEIGKYLVNYCLCQICSPCKSLDLCFIIMPADVLLDCDDFILDIILNL